MAKNPFHQRALRTTDIHEGMDVVQVVKTPKSYLPVTELEPIAGLEVLHDPIKTRIGTLIPFLNKESGLVLGHADSMGLEPYDDDGKYNLDGMFLLEKSVASELGLSYGVDSDVEE